MNKEPRVSIYTLIITTSGTSKDGDEGYKILGIKLKEDDTFLNYAEDTVTSLIRKIDEDTTTTIYLSKSYIEIIKETLRQTKIIITEYQIGYDISDDAVRQAIILKDKLTFEFPEYVI